MALTKAQEKIARQDKINLPVGVCYNGKHYPGITVHDGVGMELIDNCAGGKAVQFTGAKLQNLPTPNTLCISAPIIEKVACKGYLQVRA